MTKLHTKERLEMNQISKYKIGWIGLRVSRLGKSSSVLRNLGWIKMGHADINNRLATDWTRPCRTQEQFNAMDWRLLADAGLVATAFWYSDAQWKFSYGLTEQQWKNRATIEQYFNSKYPNGRTI